jgi:hypothetical protein
VTEERRYREEEVREIFEAAARERPVPGSSRAVVSSEGLTLAELQAIGGEVGLAPDRVAEAAAALDRQGALLPRRTWLGIPYAVGRTVDLPRAPTDREWERLVADLRETFEARGKLESHGSIRGWSNGNLHAYVEPTDTGYRLRMGTLKGNASQMALIGVFGVLFGLMLLLTLLSKGRLAEAVFIPLIFGGGGVAALTTTALGLPRWANEREEQMEYIAARASTLLESAPDADDE